MSIGFRPKGESGPAYHPDRDYAYITPTLMCAAIDRLETAPSEELKAWKLDHDIQQDEINAAAEALARAQHDFVNAADPVNSFEQALNRRDWFAIRYAVRQLLFASIGEVFCSAWFTAVRDVSRVNEDSPAASGMIDFSARVRQFVGANTAISESERRVNALQMRNDILQSRINTLGQQLKELNIALTEKTAAATLPPPVTKSWLARLFFWK
jgi:hypothetical protein